MLRRLTAVLTSERGGGPFSLCRGAPRIHAGLVYNAGTGLRGKGIRLLLGTGADERIATLMWLTDALEHAHTQGERRIIGYLGAVLEDVEFEMEFVARRS